MFVQQISFATDDPDRMFALAEEWATDAMSDGTVLRTGIGADRDHPGRYQWIVYFESADTARQNSDRAETAAFSARFSELCSDGPTFTNLDIVRHWPQ